MAAPQGNMAESEQQHLSNKSWLIEFIAGTRF
jgi:hypothetical protein